jgi:hypothetical protein
MGGGRSATNNQRTEYTSRRRSRARMKEVTSR